MANQNSNKNLHKAKSSKNDEFYTQLSDIERELKHYKAHFKDKVILCNCDDPRISNFFLYFSLNYEKLGLKKLITICYKNQDADLFSRNDSDQAIYMEYTGQDDSSSLADQIKRLEGDGDFRSRECIELLKQCDIVVTNPPFSLFREYVSQLFEYDKKFIIIGSYNPISYKEIFNLIKDNRLWLGYTHPERFIVPDHYELRKYRSWKDENGVNWRSLGNACWFTNLDIKKRHEDLVLWKKYNPEEYPNYDNFDAINVNRTSDIPYDYPGSIGVPITFLDKYNPEQFEIETLGIGEDNFTPTKKYGKFRDATSKQPVPDKRDYLLYIKDKNGKYLTTEDYRVTKVYARIIIRNKKVSL